MRKVAIVARAPTTRYKAPFHDQSWEIWNLSPMGAPHFTDLPRWDRFYELHHLDEKNAEVPGVIEFLSLYGDKVWIREEHPELPKANVYPRKQIFEFFQQGFAQEFRYYNNQVSLMMAHAIYEGVDELAIYGVDMSQTLEYQHQSPSCQVFIGWAAGAGIKVTIPDECDMLKCHRVYGLEDQLWHERKIAVQIQEMEDKVSRLYRELDESKKQQVGAAAAHGELLTLLESLNGQATPELQGVVKSRLGSLEQIANHNKYQSDRLEEDIKIHTGAIEAYRHMGQFI